MKDTRIRRRIEKRRRTGKFKRLFFLSFMTILIGAGSYFAYILYSANQAINNTYEEIDHNKLPSHRTEKIKLQKDPVTILLIGVENQEGGTGRSDVLMLVTMNPNTKETYLVSIPRDTRTYIPSKGKNDKITHSYYGGVSSTVETVQELLDIPIDYYVTTNFQGFEDIVDSLNGITVDVPFTFKAQLTGSLRWKTYTEGEMELNGNEALAYVRMRKSDPRGDMGRNDRQKQVIKAIVDKGTSFGSLTKVDDVLHDVGENVKTNLPAKDLVSFVQLYNKMKGSEVQTLQLEGYDDYINNVYYFIPNEESIKQINSTLKTVLENDSTSAATDNEDEAENVSMK
ncbi:LCP family protein [Cytobacillus suaedae]|nr:LCP family protein [Cytobacillus suaedae]